MKKQLLILCLCSINFFAFAQDNTGQKDVEYDRTIKRYFFVELIPNPEINLEASERGKIQQQHLQNIKMMAENGQLVMAGPFQEGGGLFFLDVADLKTAEELVKNDPTILSKLNTYKIKAWYTEKGLFTLENKN